MMKRRLLKPSLFMKMNWAGLFAFLLLCMLAVIWVLIVLVQHKVRHLETSYHQGLHEKALLDEEWGRLMLEKSHLSSPARIERVAREQLNMTESAAVQVMVVSPIENSP